MAIHSPVTQHPLESEATPSTKSMRVLKLLTMALDCGVCLNPYALNPKVLKLLGGSDERQGERQGFHNRLLSS